MLEPPCLEGMKCVLIQIPTGIQRHSDALVATNPVLFLPIGPNTSCFYNTASDPEQPGIGGIRVEIHPNRISELNIKRSGQ